MKYKIQLLISFLLGISMALILQNFIFSDYRSDAIVKNWGYIIIKNLEEKNQNINSLINMKDFPYAEEIIWENNFIFIKGYNNRSVLLFYKKNSNDNNWYCTTNTKLKNLENYKCT